MEDILTEAAIVVGIATSVVAISMVDFIIEQLF